MTTAQKRKRQYKALELVRRRVREWTVDVQVETDPDKKALAEHKLGLAVTEEGNLKAKGVS